MWTTPYVHAGQGTVSKVLFPLFGGVWMRLYEDEIKSVELDASMGGPEGTASEEKGRLAQNSYEQLDTCHQQDRDQESYPNDRQRGPRAGIVAHRVSETRRRAVRVTTYFIWDTSQLHVYYFRSYDRRGDLLSLRGVAASLCS